MATQHADMKEWMAFLLLHHTKNYMGGTFEKSLASHFDISMFDRTVFIWTE